MAATTICLAAVAFSVHGLQRFPQRRGRPACCSADLSESSTRAQKLPAALPFVLDPDLLADSVVYNGFGQALRGRAEYMAASTAWASKLPALPDFEVRAISVLPPDSRRRVSARYTLAFAAPIPLQVLPAQRARIRRADEAGELNRTADGLVRVTAVVASTLTLDGEGRVVRHDENLAVDPFAVTATVASFELHYARRLALLPASPTSYFAAYWGSLRALTRSELDEALRREKSDELAVLEGREDGGLSEREFEGWFTRFVVRNFLIGGIFGGCLYYAAKAIRELGNAGYI